MKYEVKNLVNDLSSSQAGHTGPIPDLASRIAGRPESPAEEPAPAEESSSLSESPTTGFSSSELE